MGCYRSRLASASDPPYGLSRDARALRLSKAGETGIVVAFDLEPAEAEALIRWATQRSWPVADTERAIVEWYHLRSQPDRKSTRLNSSHIQKSRMPSSA